MSELPCFFRSTIIIKYKIFSREFPPPAELPCCSQLSQPLVLIVHPPCKTITPNSVKARRMISTPSAACSTPITVPSMIKVIIPITFGILCANNIVSRFRNREHKGSDLHRLSENIPINWNKRQRKSCVNEMRSINKSGTV